MRVAIIGGGIQGLTCAYALGKRGIGPVTLFEAKRIGYGASSRGSGGIRAQFHNEPNIRLAIRSLELHSKLSNELGYHTLFQRGGYMYLLYNEEDIAQAEKDVTLQNNLGVPTRLISPKQAAQIVPGLNVRELRIAKYNPEDSFCHHDALMWALVRGLKKLGISIHQGSKVSRLEMGGGKIEGVIIEEKLIKADQVIVAAGTWSRGLLETVNVKVPTKPYRREKLVTETVHHFIDPLVTDQRLDMSFQQSVRGEVTGLASVPLEGSSMNWDSSLPMIEKWSRGIYELFPPLRNVAIIRQWAGTRDFTPDGTPIFGPVREVDGLWTICGQSGTGLMLAPAIAEVISKAIAGEEPRIDWEIFSPNRFERGAELWERVPTK
jgi:sarcosine oxidase subunit beta